MAQQPGAHSRSAKRQSRLARETRRPRLASKRNASPSKNAEDRGQSGSKSRATTLSSQPNEGSKTMKRSTSKLTTPLAVALFYFAAATTASSGVLSAAEVECSKWDLNGEWKLVQTNATSPIFTLHQTPTGLQGRATYWYVHEDEYIIVCGGAGYFRTVDYARGKTQRSACDE